jgi:hypothetical protein
MPAYEAAPRRQRGIKQFVTLWLVINLAYIAGMGGQVNLVSLVGAMVIGAGAMYVLYRAVGVQQLRYARRCTPQQDLSEIAWSIAQAHGVAAPVVFHRVGAGARAIVCGSTTAILLDREQEARRAAGGDWAAMGHELGHIVRRTAGAKPVLAVVAGASLAGAAAAIWAHGAHNGWGSLTMAPQIGWLVMAALGVMPTYNRLIGRYSEHEADEMALQVAGQGTVLAWLATLNESAWHDEHPPTAVRLAYVRACAQRRP